MMALAHELNSKQQRTEDRMSILKSEDLTLFDTAPDETNTKSFNMHTDMNMHRSAPPTILLDHHSVLLTVTQTCLAVFLKCFPAFIAFVLDEYEFTYSFVTRSLAIASFTTMLCVVVLPQLLYFRANVACFLICISACIGTFILWYFRHNDICFIVGVSLICNAFQLQWGASNAIISSFVNANDNKISHKYLSSLSAGWTYATFLFIGVGFVLKYQTFWDYLAWMFVILAVLSVLNLIIIPKISVNTYNQTHHSKSSKLKISICSDFKILFSLKKYRVIIFVMSLAFTTWSYMYASFGYWIKNLYNLDEEELGIAAALIEGIGNLAAIILITYLSDSNNQNKYKMKLQNMMIYFAVFLLLSVAGILLINYISFLQFMINNKTIVYVLISGYFFGSEGVIVGAMILSVTETPTSQQARSSATISITNSLCLFIGQFTVGIVYTKGGFKLETPILFSIQIILVLTTIYLSHVMKKRDKINSQLISINKHSYSIYT